MQFLHLALGTLALATSIFMPAAARTPPNQGYAASASSAAAVRTYSGSYGVTNYDDDILVARKWLDQWYGANFRDYSAPGVSWINEAGGTATACGNLAVDQGWRKGAFYCRIDHVVYLDYTFLGYINVKYGFEGIVAIMAHEFGHNAQNLSARNEPRYTGITTRVKAREWQADCYSGAVMRWLTSALPSISLANLLAEARESGDDGVDHPGVGYSHGTPQQRAQWWAYGWSTGRSDTYSSPRACFEASY
jgi:predicted metalloprotease